MSFGIPVRNGLSVSLVSSTFLSSGRRLNPALNLDFLTGGPLDPRITFSRTSQATLVDSTGKLTYAPNNLLTNSETFEASAWAKTNTAVTANATAAPDGTTTADKLINSNGVAGYVGQSLTIPAGSTFLSIYAKKGEWNWVVLGRGGANAFFNLNTGTIGTVSGGYTASIQSIGNGWYRCAMLWADNGSVTTARVYPTNADNSFTNGDGTSGVFIWGAQLEQVTYQTTPGTYNSTSPKNLLGYTQEFDNAAWTKSNAFVQTNLLLQSQAFDTASWTPGTGGSVAANTVVAPDGTQTADAYTRASSTTSFALLSQAVSSVSTNPHTFSIWMKRPSGSGSRTVRLRISDVTTSTAQSSNFTVTESWQRFEYTRTSAASTGQVGVGLIEGSTGTPLASGEVVEVWGAQLVQGSTAGDYQRTDAAAAAVQYVAPDGSRTADKLVANTTAAVHCVQQNATTAAPVAVSFYAKAAEYANAAIGSNANNYVYFDLTNGVVSSTLGTGWSSATITAIGNGWYRCAAFTSVSNTRYDIFAVNAVGTNGNTAPSYTGDNTSGVYIWGAQLSNSASLDPYVYNPVAAPTSAAYYGPRFDYDPVTLANKGLLIEEQRTNLLRYSEQFDNAVWTNASPNMPTVTSNSIIAPDGTLTADTLTAATGGTSSQTRQNVGATGLTGNFTGSVYLKAGTSTRSRVIVVDSTTAFTVVGDFSITWSGGSATIQSVALGTASLINVGNGWYRCVITGNAPSANASVMLSIFPDTISGTGSVYAYGAQLEAGAFATSYIPTVASQVTRTADVALMQGANFSNWYNQNEGSWAIEWSPYAVTGSFVAQISAATNNDRFQILNDNSIQVGITTGGVGQGGVDAGTVNAGAINKLSFAYRTNDVPASLNGGAVVSDTTVTLPVVDRLCIGATVAPAGFLNGHIRRISYYNTRLPNATLVTLTAPNIIPSLSLDFTTQVFNVG